MSKEPRGLVWFHENVCANCSNHNNTVTGCMVEESECIEAEKLRVLMEEGINVTAGVIHG